MEEVVSPLLAELVVLARERWNARFAALRKGRVDVDPEPLFAHLRGRFAGLLETLARSDPNGARAAADPLFEVSLELLASGLLGISPVSRLVARAWEEALPPLAPLLLHDPRGVCATVLNGVAGLARASPEVAERWLELLVRRGGAASSVAELRSLGLVLAWRTGQAQYREAAIVRWASLPALLRDAALGDTIPAGGIERCLEAMRSPWWEPRADRADVGETAPACPRLVGRCGGHRGFGGPFVHPPLVAARGERLFAFDAAGCWEIHADCFGTVLTRHPGEIEEDAGRGDPGFTLASDGTARRDGSKRTFAILAAPTSSASTRWTLAATLTSSHYVFLVGCS